MKEGRSTSLRAKGNNRVIPRDISESLGKLPPQAPEVEESILAGLLMEKEAMNTALSVSLKPEHFYDDRHNTVFQACVDLFAQSKPIDMRTVVHQLRSDGKLDLVGGMLGIAELTGKASNAANIVEHIRIVQEMFMKRKLIEIASAIHHDAYEGTSNAFDLLERASSELFHLDIGRSSQRQILNMVALMNLTVQNLQAKSNRGGLTGVPTGFQLLDRITSGWQNSDFIIVGARPGMGKTAFFLATSRNASKEIPVAIFSLEMSAVQLGERLISADFSIENDKMRSGILSDADWTRIGSDPTKLSSAKLFIDDTAAISTMELRSKCMRLKQEHNIGLIVIDYLQLMTGDKFGNREQEISSISKALKALAKELNVPVIALSQLSRAVEQRADKRPMLSDLRESGSLEMDTDLVIFLYRPEYYKITQDENGMPTAGICEVDVAKHRNGGTGMLKVKFEKYFTRFVDLESDTLFGNDATAAPKPTFFRKHEYDPSEARNKQQQDYEPPTAKDDLPF